jgi:hypothetical protein
MEITVRDAVTVVHGMLFGAVLLLGFTGAAIALFATSSPRNPWLTSPRQHRALTVYLSVMAALAWTAVLLGAYAVYPWYRAVPPAGTADLAGFPQHLLLSNPLTAGWHEIGMEWKEHIAWFAPLALTAVAFIQGRYGARLHAMRPLRSAVLGLIALGFVSASVAGFFGAMLNKNAPVRGGPTLVIMHGASHD